MEDAVPSSVDDQAPLSTEPVTPLQSPQASSKRRIITWRVIFVVLIVLLILTAATIGGLLLLQSQDHLSQSPATNRQAAPSATLAPTPTSAPTAALLSGQIVFYDSHNGISIADTDGSNSGSLISGDNIGFAGFNSDHNTLYYVQTDINARQTTLHGLNLNNHQDTKLLQFRPLMYDAENGSKPIGNNELADVRPDGKFALLTTNKGIVVADLTTSNQKTLLTNQSDAAANCILSAKPVTNWLSWLVPSAHAASGCEFYTFPRYTPDGTKATILALYYESSGRLLIDPLTGQQIKNFSGYGSAFFFNHTADAYAISGTGGENPGDGLDYYPNLTINKGTPLLDNNDSFGEANVSNAAWSNDNQIFVLIQPDLNSSNFDGWVINPTTQTQTLLGHTMPSIENSLLWSNDNSSVIGIDQNKKVWRINTQTKQITSWTIPATELLAIVP